MKYRKRGWGKGGGRVRVFNKAEAQEWMRDCAPQVAAAAGEPVGAVGYVNGEIFVEVGPIDKPGMRSKDYTQGKMYNAERKRIKEGIRALPCMKELGLRLEARYSRLVELPSGLIGKRDKEGRIVGSYLL